MRKVLSSWRLLSTVIGRSPRFLHVALCFGAALVAIVGMGSQAQASLGCTALNGTGIGGFPVFPTTPTGQLTFSANATGTGFSAGDVITGTIVSAAGANESLTLFEGGTGLISAIGNGGVFNYTVPTTTGAAFYITWGSTNPPAFNASWSCTPGPSTGPSAQQRQQSTLRGNANFMSRRADQITVNEPELPNRLLNGGNSGTGGPANFAAQGTLSNNRMAFSTSLRQILGSQEAAKSRYRQQLTGGTGFAQSDAARSDHLAASGRRRALGNIMALGQTSLTGNQPGTTSGLAVQSARSGQAVETLGQAGLNGESAAVSAPGATSSFDIWTQGTLSRIDDGSSENDVGLLYIGADYRISPGLLVGLLGQFDWADEKDDVSNATIDGEGWMAGPYVVARLHENLIFDGRAAWGQSDNNVNPFGTYEDSFDTTRWLVRGQLTGDFNVANLHIAPSVGVIYFEEEQDAYTDSLGVFIPGQTVSLGRVTFGPRVSTTLTTTHGGLITPHLGIKGIWDFDDADTVNVVSGLATGSDEDLRARIEGGLALRMVSGWTLSTEGFVDGVGNNDLNISGGSARLTVPLN